MTEKYILSVHIEKLGHKIQEIRERALRNIISKLESGYIFDNDLARSKEILQKLFDWFLFPEHSCEDLVLKLIENVLQSESGRTLLKYYGHENVIKELQRLHNCVRSDYHEEINDLIKDIKQFCKTENAIVPPLISDIPLSYRSNEQYIPINRSKSAESTATPIEGIVQVSSSNEQQTGIEIVNTANSISPGESTDETELYLPYFSLCWYPLINTDRHVLESVENSLRNPPEPSALLHTCEFFSDVMLHDFPAEVFLQRPVIIFELQKLVRTCTSSRIKAAVLNALIKFTKLLGIRINYFTDPDTYNLKQFFLSHPFSPLSSPIDASISSNVTSYRSNISSDIEKTETINILKMKQLPLPYYCLNSIGCILDYLYSRANDIKEAIYMRKWRICTVRALLLLNNLLDLLGLCVTMKIWDCRESEVVREVVKILREILIKFADTIDHFLFRLETISSDFEPNSRFIQINLLNSCLKLLSFTTPDDKIDIILPRNLKNVITATLLDAAISRLYPGIHDKLLELVEKFNGRYENDTFTKYQDVKAVCKSMTSAVDFLKNYKSLPTDESILLVKASLSSLDFHKKLSLIRIFIEICANKLPLVIDNQHLRENASVIVLELLSHCDTDIKKEMYRLCTKRVIGAVGPKLNTSKTGAPGSQILFLLQSSILSEITLNGLSSRDVEIQKLSEDILIHILKCKILVSEDIWNSVIQAIISTLPALLCYVDHLSPIGRTLLSLLDPDVAQTMGLTTLEILRGNSCLLFSADGSIRDEAVSRICWLLASQGDNRDLLPRINNLLDKSLSMSCQIKHVYDLNKMQTNQHYYQANSLQQVLDLLNSNNIEPVIRRSALTQISVMMEDPIMHNTFLQKDGVKIIIDVMRSALDDSDYRDYPDSIVPAASILKSICLFNARIRQNLSINLELYYLVLRGLFLFCTEERMKHEGSTLLFLLLYNYYIKGSPANFNFSLPQIVMKKFRVPFSCQPYQSKIEEVHNRLSGIIKIF
ncbi:rotatin [Holotrichia oblita]|uniref:Rotatin n=1 Tax=Holotrichia oblita TaxID=644536 RepID=A0ACB9T1L5_HOLOL|nr:rotatin [Holotrichia oblita]